MRNVSTGPVSWLRTPRKIPPRARASSAREVGGMAATLQIVEGSLDKLEARRTANSRAASAAASEWRGLECTRASEPRTASVEAEWRSAQQAGPLTFDYKIPTGARSGPLAGAGAARRGRRRRMSPAAVAIPAHLAKARTCQGVCV